MQKPKRKIGQQTFWQSFYDEHILVQRDFCYEIDRKPRKVVATLEKFWRRQREKKHITLPRYNIDHYIYIDKIKIAELKKNELWSIDIDFRDSFFTKANGQAYLEDEMTIIEVSTSFEEIVSIVVWSLLIIICFALCAIIGVVELRLMPFVLLIFSILALFPASLAYRHRKKALKKYNEFLKRLENFAIEEEEKLDDEWERLYGKAKNEEYKAKNDELSPEISKVKRK